MQEYNLFSKAAGLKARPNRMRVVREGRNDKGLELQEPFKPQLLEENPVTKALREGKIKLEINKDKQKKHMFDSPDYIEGRSAMYGTYEEMQKLVDQYTQTGQPIMSKKGKWTNKERCKANHIVGFNLNPTTGKRKEVRSFIIYYSNTGTHIMPGRGEGK